MKKLLYAAPFLILGIFAVIFSQSHHVIFRQEPITQEQPDGDKNLLDYYNQGQSLGSKGTQPLTTTFLAAGDISLSRYVAQKIQNTGDTSAPFKNVESLLKSTDFNFANLESPFGGHDHFYDANEFKFNAPNKNIQGLVDYNFKVLNLANNHAFDQGVAGIKYTRELLAQNNIRFTGTGETKDDAWTPAVYESNGIKIGFIGAAYGVNGGGEGNNYIARISDANRLATQISLLKPQADFIVVTMHAGEEYVREPNQQQTTFAHAAIDAGADVVIGHHPHWIQPIEEYNGKYIFYSLGNFIFDQPQSKETKEGLTLRITLKKEGTQNLQGSRDSAKIQKIELIPIIIDTSCCPREALSIEAREILAKIGTTQQTITP